MQRYRSCRLIGLNADVLFTMAPAPDMVIREKNFLWINRISNAIVMSTESFRNTLHNESLFITSSNKPGDAVGRQEEI